MELATGGRALMNRRRTEASQSEMTPLGLGVRMFANRD
jgi:hypothetical protein